MMSEEARKERIKKAVEAHPKEGERLHLLYQGRAIDCPVVTLPVEAVVYNSRSHRIQAQLESAGFLEDLRVDPYSEHSQKIIECTLQATEGYPDLRDNLALEGQRDAGVLTESGVLINGNTRVAALVELQEKYVRAAVLPSDAGEEEFNELEMQLQVAKDFRQAYTFTNKLLFINELAVQPNRTHAEIARSLGLTRSNERRELERAEAEVQQSLRLLALIRHLQHLAPKGALRLTDFDEAEIALKEIDAKYESGRGSNEAAARAVRNARVLGVLCDLGYREIREIQDRFVDEYLVHALADSDVLGPVAEELLSSPPNVPAGADLPGLDLLDDVEGEQASDLSSALELVLSTTGNPTVDIGDQTLSRDLFITALKGAMDDAAREARADRKASDRIVAPLKFMREAGRSLGRSLAAFQRVQDDQDFDDLSFEEALRHADGVLHHLAADAGIIL